MSFSEWALVALAGGALSVLLHRAWHSRLVCLETAWLPAALRDAVLVYAEQVFRADSPVPVVAKLDRGYRKANGTLLLVELKTRRVNRPYLSDVIELSAQRLAVQAQTGEPVADYGYVVIQPTGSRRKFAHRAALLSGDEIMALATRRAAILAGEVVPRYACSEGLCARCAFKLQCKPVGQ